MKYKIEAATVQDYNEIGDVWEASVRATHHFLDENFVDDHKPLVINEYLKMVKLACVKNNEGNILGFLGVAENKVEMLFIHPDAMGDGIGKQLMDYAVKTWEANLVDVNKQNEQAVNFYKHIGFRVIGRSELDGQGNPYPILHLSISDDIDDLKHYKMETERLLLVPLSEPDTDQLHEIFIDPFVRKYLWDDEVIAFDTTKEILHQNNEHFSNDGWGLWKLIRKEDNKTIGFAGLWIFFDENQPQLLYGLLPGFAAKGYATEASTAVIEYAFKKLSFPYLIAAMDEPHGDSIKVAERLNMHLVEKRIEDNKPTLFYRLDNK
ncbi:MAG: GNAT family N-acetyltransferase [Bacteroidota bacterium]